MSKIHTINLFTAIGKLEIHSDKNQKEQIMNSKFFIITIIIFTLLSCKNQKQTSRAKEVDLKQMIGQMIMVGFRGMSVDSINNQLLDQIENGLVGGVILFDYDIESKSTNRNIKSPQQVKTLIADLQKKSKTSLFIAVDQEGGMVNRLKPKYGFPKIASSKYLGELNVTDSTKHYASLNANNLKQLGFNVNFAPVVDIDLNPQNPVIGKYERSYSNKSDIVIQHAKTWIQAHDSLGIISTLKHFPGHGSSDADSHEGFTDITNYWSDIELTPFKTLSAMDYNIGIMTAHVFNNNIDSIFPATLSKKTIQSILRDDWNFKGLIFSDDLQMEAVNKLFDFKTILKNSINAGVDILVFGNNLEYDEAVPKKAVSLIVSMIENGEISKGSIEESYKRIMEAKRKNKN